MTVKTVASLDEWTAYADEVDEPVAHAVGELADQIRARFGADKHTAVILTEAFDSDDGACDCCTHYAEYIVIECGDNFKQLDRRDLTAWFRSWLDEPRRRAEREAAEQARKAQQAANDAAFTRGITEAFTGAVEAVESEGYANDGEWHDKLMRQLGVKGYRAT